MVHVETATSSPNYTPAARVPATFGRGPRRVESITIHHWGAFGQTFDAVVRYLCRPGGSSSAHYVVEHGRASCIVDPDDAAWHAGSARGNTTSIGIECRPEATDGDYATVAELVRALRAVYGEVPLVPHSSWKATACPGRWDLARIDALARTVPPPSPAPAPAPTPPPPPPEENDDMGFYVYADTNKGVYFFNQTKGKIRLIPKDEWSAIRAMQTGADPALPIEMHRVSAKFLDQLRALGTY